MSIELYEHQRKAVGKMHNGCILCGDVGTGKTLTALEYYYRQCGGTIDGKFSPMKHPLNLYIITTARKRDDGDWLTELTPFVMDSYKGIEVHVDSWNNIKKYKDVKGAFFIFDEQRVVGSGVWVKTFLKIAKNNRWILLSATPGDTWTDYVPVFIANGYFKTRSEFNSMHCVFSPYSKFPKIERYVDTGRLTKYRNDILVMMPMKRKTVPHHKTVVVEHDKLLYKEIMKTRWNPSKNQPFVNAAELCYELRKVSNSHPSRVQAVIDILKEKKRAIVFYNFDYELELLKNADYGENVTIGQWNGHVHERVPRTDKWVYLVQYAAGNEGWNCVTTDTVIFFSQNYSYKVLKQATGRIDRLNTPYIDLYYYYLRSHSNIDLAISKAIKNKKDFNAKAFVG